MGSSKHPSSLMSSVLRSFKVLEAVARMQPVTLGTLMKSFDLSKSTLQRTLTTLEAAGWIQQVSSESRAWEITSHALLVRPRLLEGDTLYARSRLPMVQLRDVTDETVHLSIFHPPSSMVLVDRVDSHQMVRAMGTIGEPALMHATSLGKAVLAYLPDPAVDLVLAGQLKQSTPNTIVDPDELLEELRLVRECGYAVNRSEGRRAVCAIASPIFDAKGEPVAGICISMPDSRFAEDRVAEWGSLVRAAAETISLHRVNEPVHSITVAAHPSGA